jgi:hypothetical protein
MSGGATRISGGNFNEESDCIGNIANSNQMGVRKAAIKIDEL